MNLKVIQSKIYEIRTQKVMLDYDLALLYEVETKRLNEAVKRNIGRFPSRFMFRLSPDEWNNMRSHFATASGQNKRNTAITPFAFTEHGITMLASVLNSKKAIEVNIAIVEAFITLKEFALNYKDIADKLDELENRYDMQFKDIYEAINYLVQKDKLEFQQKKRKQIGYKN